MSLYMTDYDFDSGDIRRPRYITIKVIYHKKDDEDLAAFFMARHNFQLYFKWNVDEFDFDHISCKSTVDEAKHYSCISSSSQLSSLKHHGLYYTVAEFNFRPIDIATLHTFESRLKVCLIDRDGDCLMCVKREIRIHGQL